MDTPPRKRKKATSATSLDPGLLNSDIAPSENPASAIIDVPAVEVPELTEEEQRDRLHLERRVERAFFEAGKVLAELRDRRLYRSTHSTFLVVLSKPGMVSIPLVCSTLNLTITCLPSVSRCR
jgi:hypothetical protein